MHFSLDTLTSPGGEAPSLMSSEFLMLRELLVPKHLVVYLSSVVHHVGRRNCAQKWQKGKTFLEINVRRVLSNVFLQFPRFNMGFQCFSMFFGGISASALKNCIGNNFWIRLVKIMTEALAISAWRHHDSIWPSTGCPVRVDQARKAVSNGSLWSQDVSSASISQVQSIMKSVNNLNSSFRSRTLPAQPVSILLMHARRCWRTSSRLKSVDTTAAPATAAAAAASCPQKRKNQERDATLSHHQCTRLPALQGGNAEIPLLFRTGQPWFGFDLARATRDRSRQPTGHRGSPDRKLKECFIEFHRYVTCFFNSSLRHC